MIIPCDYSNPVRADPSASSGVNARLPAEACGEGWVEAYERMVYIFMFAHFDGLSANGNCF